jgi:hypothetical protein
MRPEATETVLDRQTYPTTTEAVVASDGDVEIDHADGAETVAEILGRLGPTTYGSAAELRNAIYSAVEGGAVGRRHYSDRDAYAPGEDGHDAVSF